MAQQLVNLGTTPNGADGDTTRTGFDKTNQNFTDVYTQVAGKLSLPSTLQVYSPTLTPATGAYSNAAIQGAYTKFGRMVFFEIYITITAVGSGGYPVVGLPFAAAPGFVQFIAGRETTVNGVTVVGQINASASTMTVYNAANGNPAVNGAIIALSGLYVAAS